jgi:hypothetical protein
MPITPQGASGLNSRFRALPIWTAWLLLLLTAPIIGMWVAAISSMALMAYGPPLSWVIAVVGWILAAVGFLVWSNSQSRRDSSLWSLRWAVHSSGLVIALLAGIVSALMYFYSGNDHG